MTGDGDADTPSMLARRWTIAANYHSPEDFDIPHAPRFQSETTDDGTLRLLDQNSVVLEASVTSRVRR